MAPRYRAKEEARADTGLSKTFLAKFPLSLPKPEDPTEKKRRPNPTPRDLPPNLHRPRSQDENARGLYLGDEGNRGKPPLEEVGARNPVGGGGVGAE